MKKQPVRLTTEQFIHPASSYQIYFQHINEIHALHWHEFYELCFVLRGRGMNTVNGTAHELRKGSLFLLTPADFHEIYSYPDEPMELYNLVFDEKLLDQGMREFMFGQVAEYMVDLNEAHHDAIESEFSMIRDEVQLMKPGHSILIKGAFERILLYLFRTFHDGKGQPELPVTPSQSSTLQRALVYMHHHFREELRLEDAAKQAGLAPNYFSLVFHKMTGISFQIYLQGLRLQFAKSLLQASDIPITEICFASGFNTLTHFERAFKQKYGSSPRTFRSN
ncbi:AraC family transcriptional regulator [Paenibacillus oryzisoli]|uniref:HTH araC/xylS-type domain-containing protein n=1 Tax=Paenibacillus oryzisoli TaxID=1850517 RepID=A0A198ACY6_9BACL|nr:AraC family transcriptional regulator [Paenibacillus oryzisoli]OAS19027.1 hypothetical protein A8708_27245 [Paenibacillus oryzisoli]